MSVPPASLSPKLFLLHPKNQAFANRQGRRISDGRSTGCLALLLTGFVVFGVMFFAVIAGEALRWWRIESSGMVTTAQYVARRTALVDRELRHYVTFRYNHAQDSYDTEQQIDEHLYNLAQIGASLNVRFVPSNPRLARIVGQNRFPLGIGIFVLIWNGVTLVIAVRIWRQYWRLRVLERKGELIQGMLMGSCASHDSDGDLLLHVDYTFTPPSSDAPIERHAKVIRNDLKDARLPPTGSAVQVLYYRPDHFMLL